MGKLKRTTIKKLASVYLEFDGTPLSEMLIELTELEAEYGPDAFIDYSYNCESSYQMELYYFTPESDKEFAKRQKVHDRKLAQDKADREEMRRRIDLRDKKEYERLKEKYGDV